MASLHVINVPPGHSRLAECLACLHADDTLLLIEDAVMALTDRSIHWPTNVDLRALGPDLDARGIDLMAFSSTVTAVSYGEFVTLTLESNKVICW